MCISANSILLIRLGPTRAPGMWTITVNNHLCRQQVYAGFQHLLVSSNVQPRMLSAWGYKQLLQRDHCDNLWFHHAWMNGTMTAASFLCEPYSSKSWAPQMDALTIIQLHIFKTLKDFCFKPFKYGLFLREITIIFKAYTGLTDNLVTMYDTIYSG